MSHIKPLNQKARRLAALVDKLRGTARPLTQDPPPTEYPFGCTTMFAPGWEVDSSGGGRAAKPAAASRQTRPPS